MTALHIVDPASVLAEALTDASPDLMRSLLQTTINTLLSADADFHRRSELKKRFGTALASGRNVGHRTGDVSLAPRLIAEGSHV